MFYAAYGDDAQAAAMAAFARDRLGIARRGVDRLRDLYTRTVGRDFRRPSGRAAARSSP
jgi:hypothetical protein